MGHLEGNFTPVYIWDARFLKVKLPISTCGVFALFISFILDTDKSVVCNKIVMICRKLKRWKQITCSYSSLLLGETTATVHEIVMETFGQF